jgi:hypothetical protein
MINLPDVKGIICLEGPANSCKSLLSARFALRAFNRGETIRSNTPLAFGAEKVKYYDRLEELKRARDCVIILDEGQLPADNRDWQNLPKCFYDMLPQHRKRRITLLVNTQKIPGVDIKIRRIIDYQFFCDYIKFLRFPNDCHKYPFFQLSTISFFPYLFPISKLWTKKVHYSFAVTGLQPSITEVLINDRGTKIQISDSA